MEEKITELKKQIKELEKQVEETKKGTTKSKKKTKNEKTLSSEGKSKFTPLKEYFKWQAPSRTFVKRDKPWFLKVAILALLLILFFAFLQDFIVILVVCVIVLITFLLASIPPDTVTHHITNKGIKSIGTKYKWKELKEFWVAEKQNTKIVYISTKLKYPPRLIMLISKKDEEQVVRYIGQYLEYKEYDEKQGWISRKSDGIMVNPRKYEHLFTIKPKTKKS